MSDNKDGSSIPAWDGSARSWRRYTREVSWWVHSTPVHKRRYCASRLLSRLTGPARLLAISWSKVGFDAPDGVKKFLQRLASSPLVRRSLPNAAAICQQYFGFKRNQGESIQNFLVRETLMHEEFVEALVRLHEDKVGVSQADRDFGLPTDSEYDYDWNSYHWNSWWTGDAWEEEPENQGEEDLPEVPVPPGDHERFAEDHRSGAPGERVPGTTGSSPSHQHEPSQRGDRDRAPSVPEADPDAKQLPQPLDELTLADSFILDVLRGWRLLQAAGLSHEEKRDILSTTKNSLDYSVISSALQGLWDDQLLGQRHQGSHNLHYLNGTDEFQAYYQDDSWWNEDEDGWWFQGYSAEDGYDDDWWWNEPLLASGDPEGMYTASVSSPPEDPEATDRIKEAQRAEQVAENLAAEAHRTWTEAQRATAALKRDRGFGAVMSKGGPPMRCYNCGGNHLARDCPDRRAPGPKGYGGKFHSYILDDYDAYYFGKGKGKGKGKTKGKRANWMEAQAWFKGKGKHKTKDSGKSVNAYNADLFAGGLELSEGLELHASTPEPVPQHQGMLDCGATASAAPEAVVQGLIGAVLACDKSAKIELDQAARPYFRFGNGRWGRALCRVHISSKVSGQERTFSLYTLPNPVEYYQSNFDKQTLVPVLVGMDFLGKNGSGVLIDFGTGLAMCTRDDNPEIFQLHVNAKGHYVYDIVHHLTRGFSCKDGNAHVIVRHPKVDDSLSMSHQMLELWTAWVDLTVSDMELNERELAVSRDRLWRVYREGHVTAADSAVPAQMCGPSVSAFPTSSSSSSHGCFSRIASGSHLRPRAGENPHSCSQGQSPAEAACQIPGQVPCNEPGPSRSSSIDQPVALLQQACSGQADVECARPVGPLSSLRPTSPLYPEEGSSCHQHGHRQCQHGAGDAGRAPRPPGCSEANGNHMPPRHGQDCGGPCSSGCHCPTSKPASNDTGDSFNEPIASVNSVGRGGRGGADLCHGGRAGPTSVNKLKTLTSSSTTSTPLFMAKKVVALLTLMATTASSLLLGLHLSDRDGLWEVACGPHSWLSQAAEEHGLRPRRINVANGYNLYDRSTWDRLRELRQQRRPRKIWISLPCTKWCAWTVVNFNTPALMEKLEEQRRRERRMIWMVVAFLKETIEEDPDVDIYWEWPWPCQGWKQRPLEELESFLEKRQLDWLPCRVDGCVYGMKDRHGAFLRKKWMIKTTDDKFHRVFRAKTCCGNHGQHGAIEGQETEKSAYYPWKLVQAWTRHWKEQLTPERHLRLLSLRDDCSLENEDDNVSADYVISEDCEALEEYEGDFMTCDESGDLTACEQVSVESLASEAFQHQDFSMSTCKFILGEFCRNLATASPGPEHHRWKMPNTSASVFGAFSHGAFHGVTKASNRHASLVKFVNAYLRHHLPGQTWSSFMITWNGVAQPHRDVHNLKGTLNVVHGLGSYSGGGLWLCGKPPLGQPVVRRRGLDGSYLQGYVENTFERFVVFDPSTIHASQAFQGSLIMLSAYTTRMLPHLCREDRQNLRDLGFPLPKSSTSSSTWAAPAVIDSSPTSLTLESVSSQDRARWEAQVAKFHKAAGHPTNRNLAKIVKDAGHEDWKVEIALKYDCPACKSLKQGGTSSGQIPPVATHSTYAAWQAVGVDSGEWVPPGSKIKVKFLLFMDVATKLRVVCPLFTYPFLEMRTESGQDLISGFTEHWIAHYPRPKVIILDAAKSFVSDAAHEFASSLNIGLSFVAEKEAWAHGVIEAGVQDLKMIASAIHLDALTQNPYVTLWLATSSLNATEFTAGFSSFQWAFGSQYNLSDEDVRTFASANCPDNFTKLVTAREQAQATALKTRGRRVLSKLANSTVRQPLKTFAAMDLVKIWRRVWPKEQHQGPRGGLKKSGRPHWVGPGRVIFSEVLPHQRCRR